MKIKMKEKLNVIKEKIKAIVCTKQFVIGCIVGGFIAAYITWNNSVKALVGTIQ